MHDLLLIGTRHSEKMATTNDRAGERNETMGGTIVRTLLPVAVTVALLLSILLVVYTVSWLFEFHL